MKTREEIRRHYLRSQMRCHAMNYREAIHPKSYYRGLASRVHQAAHSLQLAIDYRRMAE